MRDYAEVRADGRVTREVARAALAVYDVDELGLDRLDRAVLDALVAAFGGGPVGVATLAVAVGEEPDTVEEVCEPFLVRAGLLARTPRGRVATEAAWRHLGHPVPRGRISLSAGAQPTRRQGRRQRRCSTPRLHALARNSSGRGRARPARSPVCAGSAPAPMYPSGPSPGRTHRA